MMQLLVLVAIFIGGVYGNLRCLSCAHSPVSSDCQYVTLCGANEECYADLLTSRDGHLHIEHGCRDSKICGTSSRQVGKRNGSDGTIHTRSEGDLICSQCCNSSDLCNEELCGQTGLPKDLGPVCFGCDQQLTPSSCNTITQCGSNEVCQLERILSPITHKPLYKTGCIESTTCNSNLNVLSNMFGRKKRSTKQMEDQNGDCIIKCCNTNLCNQGPCASTTGGITNAPPTAYLTSPVTTSITATPTITNALPVSISNTPATTDTRPVSITVSAAITSSRPVSPITPSYCSNIAELYCHVLDTSMRICAEHVADIYLCQEYCNQCWTSMN